MFKTFNWQEVVKALKDAIEGSPQFLLHLLNSVTRISVHRPRSLDYQAKHIFCERLYLQPPEKDLDGGA